MWCKGRQQIFHNTLVLLILLYYLALMKQDPWLGTYSNRHTQRSRAMKMGAALDKVKIGIFSHSTPDLIWSQAGTRHAKGVVGHRRPEGTTGYLTSGWWSRANAIFLLPLTTLRQGKKYRLKSPDIFDIFFLSVGVDKKISIFFV